MSDSFTGPAEQEFAVDVIVTIQNVATLLFAFAPDIAAQTENEVVIVEPDNFEQRPNEIWKLHPVHTAEGLYWTILNLKTQKYAWDPVDPQDGEPVFLKSDERLWKIEHVHANHYRITPKGPKQDILDWTDKEPVQGAAVTLEHRTNSETQHWIFTRSTNPK